MISNRAFWQTDKMERAPAEIEEQPFKHQNRPSAAEDGERLAGQQTENPSTDRCAQKTLQHPLQTRRETIRESFKTW